MKRSCCVPIRLRHPRVYLSVLVAFLVFLGFKLLPVQFYLQMVQSSYLTQDDFYLLISPTCRIVNLNPWNDEAKRYYVKKAQYECAATPVFTQLVVDTNNIDVYIQINHALPSRNVPNFKCCLANITRKRTPTAAHTFDDNQVHMSPCLAFDSFPQRISNDNATYVRCFDADGSSVYENIHRPIALTEEIRKKLAKTTDNRNNKKDSHRVNRQLSVMILGIDSVSRLNFIRTMPHTYNFVQSHPDWMEFKVFQKMGDNTLPNLMAMLTGFNQSQSDQICQPRALGGLDSCPFIWKRFSERGYVTAYAEDSAKISTFNYEKPGFNNSPVDYYMRAYHLGAAHFLPSVNIDATPFCSGLMQEGERVWKVALDFARLHKDNPYFGLFWTNSYSHEDVNTPTRMDDKIRDYLLEITDIVEENTFIIFLSDHGIRFGAIRNTLTGYLEERLPFLYFRLPAWFKKEFAVEFANLKTNTHRLVTPFDIYMTLQRVLSMADDSYRVEDSLGCPKCRPLTEVVPLERSCEDANITDHWCTCSNLEEIDIASRSIQDAADMAVRNLNALVEKLDVDKWCAHFQLGFVLKAFQATNHYGGNDDLVVVEFQTIPQAQFEVSVHTGKMEIYGGFSRLDSYKITSACTNNPILKLFCYCKDIGEYWMDRVNTV